MDYLCRRNALGRIYKSAPTSCGTFSTTPFGYTLIEVLLVVAMLASLLGITIAYTMYNADLEMAELEFREHYQKAKSILLYARNLHIGGFRSNGDLNIEQLQAATRGSDREVLANRIAQIITGHAKDDFKIRFAGKYIQVKFLVADEVASEGYPVRRRSLSGSKDEILLTKMIQAERSRALKLNDYLMN